MTVFGDRLRMARRKARDPQGGGGLTQERLAERIGERGATPGFPTPGTVSNWECGRSQPGGHDRRTLCTIVEVLLEGGGLANAAEASALLASGGYAPLTEHELQAIEQRRGTQSESLATREGGGSNDSPPSLPAPDKRVLIAIRHQSMEQIPPLAIRDSLPEELHGFTLEELVIDQFDLFQARRLMDPRAAAQRQDGLEARVTQLLDRHRDAHVAYFGTANIPLHFLAGFQLSSRRPITLFEFDRHRHTWRQLQRGGPSPELRCVGLPSRVRRARGPVVVRVSVYHHVTTAAVAAVVPAPIASVHLTLAAPQVDVVTSTAHVWEYAGAFRAAMDQIHRMLPNATGIHIFFAGPSTLAFCCGQQVSKTIHPSLVVYDYVGQNNPQYSWGLDLTRPVNDPDFLIAPGDRHDPFAASDTKGIQ